MSNEILRDIIHKDILLSNPIDESQEALPRPTTPISEGREIVPLTPDELQALSEAVRYSLTHAGFLVGDSKSRGVYDIRKIPDANAGRVSDRVIELLKKSFPSFEAACSAGILGTDQALPKNNLDVLNNPNLKPYLKDVLLSEPREDSVPTFFDSWSEQSGIKKSLIDSEALSAAIDLLYTHPATNSSD